MSIQRAVKQLTDSTDFQKHAAFLSPTKMTAIKAIISKGTLGGTALSPDTLSAYYEMLQEKSVLQRLMRPEQTIGDTKQLDSMDCTALQDGVLSMYEPNGSKRTASVADAVAPVFASELVKMEMLQVVLSIDDETLMTNIEGTALETKIVKRAAEALALKTDKVYLWADKALTATTKQEAVYKVYNGLAARCKNTVYGIDGTTSTADYDATSLDVTKKFDAQIAALAKVNSAYTADYSAMSNLVDLITPYDLRKYKDYLKATYPAQAFVEELVFGYPALRYEGMWLIVVPALQTPTINPKSTANASILTTLDNFAKIVPVLERAPLTLEMDRDMYNHNSQTVVSEVSAPGFYSSNIAVLALDTVAKN